MKVKLIANPESGKGRGARLIDKAISSLTQHGLIPDISLTEHPGHARALASEAMGSFDIIAGLGGDGTMNEIASALKNTDVPLAVYPAGTGNDFIKAIGKNISYDQMSAAAAEGRTASLDMASVNGRDILNVLGIGFDAVVSARNAKVRRLGGIASYVYALLRSLIDYRHYPLILSLNGRSIDAKALFLTIGNGPVCGGGFMLTPGAAPDDGLLDITLISDLPLRSVPFQLPKAFNGRIAETGHTRMFRASRLSITSHIPLPSHIDGDPFEPYATRYDIEVLPKALTVISP